MKKMPMPKADQSNAPFLVGVVWTSPERFSWVLCGIHAFAADRPYS